MLLFFLALPQKGPKRSSPLKPIGPRKPKFPPIPQGHDSRPFWLPATAGPESRLGHRTFHIANFFGLQELSFNQGLIKPFESRQTGPDMEFH
jgi:hypothetical protein